ncbi:hypothetical protein MMC25_006611 [Agyrium rufum]|nr:hypothetical protein [Agyrium rufum]
MADNFEPSPRASKRRKVTADIPPSSLSTPRSLLSYTVTPRTRAASARTASKPPVTHGSARQTAAKRLEAFERNVRCNEDAQANGRDVEADAGQAKSSSFVDSAYQSMSTPDLESEGDAHSGGLKVGKTRGSVKAKDAASVGQNAVLKENTPVMATRRSKRTSAAAAQDTLAKIRGGKIADRPQVTPLGRGKQKTKRGSKGASDAIEDTQGANIAVSKKRRRQRSTSLEDELTMAQNTPTKRSTRSSGRTLKVLEIGTSPSHEEKIATHCTAEPDGPSRATATTSPTEAAIENQFEREEVALVRSSGRLRHQSRKLREISQAADSSPAPQGSGGKRGKGRPKRAVKHREPTPEPVEEIEDVEIEEDDADEEQMPEAVEDEDEREVEMLEDQAGQRVDFEAELIDEKIPSDLNEDPDVEMEVEMEEQAAEIDSDEDSATIETPVPTLSKKRGRPRKKPPGMDSTTETLVGTSIEKEDLEETTCDIATSVPQPITSPKVTKTLQQSLQDLQSQLHDPDVVAELGPIRRTLLEVLSGHIRLPLHELEDEYLKVYRLIEQTVVAGEGNSMLVIGPRGTAKTNLVETAISEITSQHGDQFHVVRLNGFIHTDDKIALKDIWRQLGREMEVEDEGGKGPTSYADNLASLLALLSHPTEYAQPTDTDQTLEENQANQTSRSILFVLSEFDLFTTHSRQTLLYNLFDIAQARKAPIAVLGLTTRVDAMEHLEKRVKSRFSHRYVYLSLPRSFHAFREICCSALKTLTSTEGVCRTPKKGTSFKQRLEQHDNNMMQVEDTNGVEKSNLSQAWNTYITHLLHTDPHLTILLEQIYSRTKSVAEFMTACLLPISTLSPTSIPKGADFLPLLTSTAFTANIPPTPKSGQAFTATGDLRPPDSKLSLLLSLSTLSLALLIAAARLTIIYESDSVNFNMAYDEYASLAEKARLISSTTSSGIGGGVSLGAGGIGRVWSRDVALGAWERLERLDLLIPAAGSGGTGVRGAGGGHAVGATADLGKAGRLCKVDVALEEIGAAGQAGSAEGLELSEAMRRWCREI